MRNKAFLGLVAFTYSFAALAVNESIYDLPTESISEERQVTDSNQLLVTERVPENAAEAATMAAMDRAMTAAGIDIKEQPNLAITTVNGVPSIGVKPEVGPALSTPVNFDQAIKAQNVVSGRDDSMDKIRKKYKSHQKVSIKAGHTELIPISAGMTNRIWTEFKNVKTTTSVPADAALIHADGSFVYIVPGSNVNSIDLILEEEGAPETAVNLTLIPLDVPPVMVELKVDMNRSQKEAQRVAIATSEEEELIELEAAKQAERERLFSMQNPNGADAHVNSIMTLLEKVALADIPTGYELLEGNEIDPAKRFPCEISKILPLYHEVKQQLVGARTVVDIIEIRNDVNGLRTFRDESCMGENKEDVIAVAVLDKATLAPGESAEVYIVRDRFYFERQSRKPKRKRVAN
jgi:conjugal transfer pilus assembly protein TraK